MRLVPEQAGGLQEAIESLLNAEKQCRQAEDEVSTKQLVVAIVRLCFEARDLALLKSNLALLAKRRAQFPQAVAEMVRAAIAQLDSNVWTRADVYSLIDTLLLVSTGKMYVEVERARLVLRQARMYEADGDVRKAATTLQEVTVETLGSMDKREKLEYILEQMRLCLAASDYVRTLIISRKIAPAVLLEDELQDLKLVFHSLLLRYHLHEGSYVEVCRSYLAMYNTPKVLADDSQWPGYFTHAIAFAVLAPWATDQQDLLARIKADKNIDNVGEFARIVRAFTTPDVLSWTDFIGRSGAVLNGLPEVFTGEAGAKRMADLQLRVTQHNIRIVSRYYSRIQLARLAELLSVEVALAESVLSAMVTSKVLYARIDRPAGIVCFKQQATPASVLNDWSSDMSKLLAIVETCTQSITKEKTMHADSAAAAAGSRE